MNSTQYLCTEEDENKRIDYLLANLVDDMGLRARRRLCEQGLIHINNKIAKASDKVRANNIITMYPPIYASDKDVSIQETTSKLSIIKENTDYAALCKPAQMHSERVAGTATNNVQDKLPSLFIDKKPILLNRLDFATSGILMIAFSDDAKREWERYQSRKGIKKIYLALVEGKLEHEVNVKYALILKNKHNVRVDKNSIGQRYTKVYPLAHAKDSEGNDISLVSCMITQGARHQIRAHLTSIGHPLLSDIKYDAKKQYSTQELTSVSMFQSPLIPYDLSCNPDMLSIIAAPYEDSKRYKEQEINEGCNTSQDAHSHEIPEFNKLKASTKKNDAHTLKDKECFILHHIKLEFSHFEVSCLPDFWQNISLELQEHILAHIN